MTSPCRKRRRQDRTLIVADIMDWANAKAETENVVHASTICTNSVQSPRDNSRSSLYSGDHSHSRDQHLRDNNHHHHHSNSFNSHLPDSPISGSSPYQRQTSLTNFKIYQNSLDFTASKSNTLPRNRTSEKAHKSQKYDNISVQKLKPTKKLAQSFKNHPISRKNIDENNIKSSLKTSFKSSKPPTPPLPPAYPLPTLPAGYLNMTSKPDISVKIIKPEPVVILSSSPLKQVAESGVGGPIRSQTMQNVKTPQSSFRKSQSLKFSAKNLWDSGINQSGNNHSDNQSINDSDQIFEAMVLGDHSKIDEWFNSIISSNSKISNPKISSPKISSPINQFSEYRVVSLKCQN